MLEKNYRNMNEQIVPDKALMEHTIGLANDDAAISRPKRISIFQKSLVVAAMLLIGIFTAMPALAANVPAMYELMYLMSPPTAQFFMPVNESCEDNGIKMEVVATNIHDNTAQIYIALQDLTGDRVDETIDLFDSYSIHRPFDSAAHCERVSYNGGTKTATFLITITEYGNHKIEGRKLTFSVRNFISNKREYVGIPILADLVAVPAKQETKIVTVNGFSGMKFEGSQEFDDGAAVLVPSDEIVSPVEGIAVTGIGYVDGKLHIQTSVKNPLKNDNHGDLFLKRKDGKETAYEYSFAFTEYGEPGDEDTRIRYNEYVFDIPQSELADYMLYGSFYTSGLYTEGMWQVTFPLTTTETGN